MIPLIVITGPTASGKTDVALHLAKELNGEIICADSRTVYRGLDIGTAKTTKYERALVPHHLLDVVDLDEVYNLARFQRDARAAIADIRHRGRVPFLVGGSGLYIDSVVLEYELGTEPDVNVREALEQKSIDELFNYCLKNNIKLPDNLYNKRYLIRAIEQGGINNARRTAPNEQTFVVAISTEISVLKTRIAARAQKIFEDGAIEEGRLISEKYGWNVAPLQSPAYKAVRRFLNNEITQDEAIASLAHDDWQLARKQMTWLRRHSWIEWLPVEDVESRVHSILAQASMLN